MAELLDRDVGLAVVEQGDEKRVDGPDIPSALECDGVFPLLGRMGTGNADIEHRGVFQDDGGIPHQFVDAAALGPSEERKARGDMAVFQVDVVFLVHLGHPGSAVGNAGNADGHFQVVHRTGSAGGTRLLLLGRKAGGSAGREDQGGGEQEGDNLSHGDHGLEFLAKVAKNGQLCKKLPE